MVKKILLLILATLLANPVYTIKQPVWRKNLEAATTFKRFMQVARMALTTVNSGAKLYAVLQGKDMKSRKKACIAKIIATATSFPAHVCKRPIPPCPGSMGTLALLNATDLMTHMDEWMKFEEVNMIATYQNLSEKEKTTLLQESYYEEKDPVLKAYSKHAQCVCIAIEWALNMFSALIQVQNIQNLTEQELSLIIMPELGAILFGKMPLRFILKDGTFKTSGIEKRFNQAAAAMHYLVEGFRSAKALGYKSKEDKVNNIQPTKNFKDGFGTWLGMASESMCNWENTFTI